LQRRGDNELAPGDSDDTSFNECRGNVWNLRSGTMSCYWPVTCSPAHPPFVLMKPDTCFLCLPCMFGAPLSGVIIVRIWQAKAADCHLQSPMS
jgi:NAD-dependent dihydropyrimidine dehydrogenase PreA subunit